MQPYSVAHLRQNLSSQPQASTQPPNAAHSNKPTSDIEGKRREADSASSRTQLEAIPEDPGANEERGLGPSSLARPSPLGSSTASANLPLFSGAINSTADIYRRPEPLLQNSYPHSYHYSTPSASKSTFISPAITVNSPSSSLTSHGQTQHHTTAGSPSKSLGSAVSQVYSTIPSHSLQASPTQQRRSHDYTNHPGITQNAPIRRRNHGIAPLTSDARTEHVLLAARRIGRERAGLVAGILQHVEREKEVHARELEVIRARQDLARSEKERLERLANGTSGLAYYRSTDTLASPQQRNTGKGSAATGVPRTPKRSGGVGTTSYPGLGAFSNSPTSSPARAPTSAGPSTFVFVNTSAIAGTSGHSDRGVSGNPSQLNSAHKRGGVTRSGSKNLPSNPPTPLDSLLDAARSMMDDGVGGKAGGKINGTRKALEHPESPVPKRRRVSSGSKMVGRGGVAGASTTNRVRSALDVLADQAAAASDEPGQGRRSSTRGKGKEKFSEDLGGVGDGGVDDIQEDDDDNNDSGLRECGSSIDASSRRRGRAKPASVNTRPLTEPTSTSSMSLRPVRQASQKRLASQDLQPLPSVSTTAARGKGRFRGRPKGSKSVSRSAVSMKSSSTSKSSSLGPRVISSAPTYSPLDEAIALLPQKGRRQEKDRAEEHAEWTTANLDHSSGMGSPRLGLRPVVEWGERVAEEEEGDEDVEDEGERGRELELGQQNGQVEGELDPHGATAVEAGDEKMATRSTPDESESVSSLKITVQDIVGAETQVNPPNDVPINGQVIPADVDVMTVLPTTANGTDANPEADLDDEDAEGEEEDEDEENADAEGDQNRSSRTRTPPPPDPPHPGAPPDSNDDSDGDADAEGDMDFEENEELPPTSTNSTMYQTALSVSMGQVPPGNFDGSLSFSGDKVWLIKFFWMKSDKFFGLTCTGVFVSAEKASSVISVINGEKRKS